MGKFKDIIKKQESRKARNDVIFIASLLLVVLVFACVLFFSAEEGNMVRVTVDGRLFGEYSLLENKTVEIVNGDGYNLLIIQDGKAYVDTASCPDGICSSHRPVSRGGESIICLPNKVVIEIHTVTNSGPDIAV